MPGAPARLPPWLRTRLGGGSFGRTREIARSAGLHTVCEEALCPNIGECWGAGSATFLVLGPGCTRGCRFCGVASGRPAPPDPDEPARLAAAVARLGLGYAVITMVCRDDLPDRGAGHVAACVAAVKAARPGTLVEALVGDFGGDRDALAAALSAGPEVLSHNIETVERAGRLVRDGRCDYRASLGLLRAVGALAPGIVAKSSLMLGLGETEAEVLAALSDLRAAGVSIVTIGQYLRPSRAARHLPVAEYVHPDRFDALGAAARRMGFLGVASGPFVRSSYRAAELYAGARAASPPP